jgi:hypothetical protein
MKEVGLENFISLSGDVVSNNVLRSNWPNKREERQFGPVTRVDISMDLKNKPLNLFSSFHQSFFRFPCQGCRAMSIKQSNILLPRNY